MENLKDAVLRYRDMTIEIINSINIDNFDNLSNLFALRAEIIEEIKKMNYTKEEFTDCYHDIGADAIDNKLRELMYSKRTYLQSKIKMSSRRQNVNRSYLKRYNADPMFFNRKL